MLDSWQSLNLRNDLKKAIEFYETAIESNENIVENYHYLGLALLLSEQEEEAQMVWLLGLENATPDKSYDQKLGKILEDEANYQEKLNNHFSAWIIRHHLRQVCPLDFNNLVQIVYLSLHLKLLTSETLSELDFLGLLETESKLEINDNIILQLSQNVLTSEIPFDESIEFTSRLIPYIKDIQVCLETLIYVAERSNFERAQQIINQLCLVISPQSLTAKGCLTQMLSENGYHQEAIQLARSLPKSDNLSDQVVSYQLLLGTIMQAAEPWQEIESIYAEYQLVLDKLVAESPKDLPSLTQSFLCCSYFFSAYLNDIPKVAHPKQNQALKLFQENICYSKPELVEKFQPNLQSKHNHKQLKIGYISNCLRKHSVGWLARSLIQHHDRDSFEIYGYFPWFQQNDFLQQWYASQMHKSFRGDIDYWGDHTIMADEIYKDEIDILIDLDSLTVSNTCSLMSLKPAPVQVTWLGWDASGLPAIDYYIADPYVLPEDAQEYYSEKIWRLPNTYLGIDGFESSLANIERSELGIPNDAIIYFSSQQSRKRHPETVRSQMKIIKQVPNSYFLIKGLAGNNNVQDLFYSHAEAEGVEFDRLRFLPTTNSEAEHRANLAIADVVLDTYPYNGATTTMEVLWMGIPMVTRVGEQFVSRNGYTMMMNAGITEGIAWNASEYVEWGVRFGKEPLLRQEVSWKLRRSRQTSPLWNGRQFAKEMEKAYTQMWEIYNG
ncbi:MAG: O-linked N-acetylglucosamine transferase, SPINDLY family protein [Pseudanabaena sp.]|nr:MAG: O-linked N-acetylglucosamine transferase, SPINDLY family protein [Pseudanabaena sp.]